MDNRSLGSLKGRQFLTDQKRRVEETIEPTLAEFGVVTAVSGELVAVRTTRDSASGGQLLARVAGPPMSPSDPCVLIPVRGGGWVAAAVNKSVLPTAGGALSGPLSISTIDSHALFVETTGGTDIFNVSGLTGEIQVANGFNLRGYSDSFSTRQFEISAGTGRADFNGGVKVDGVSVMAGRIQGGRICYLTVLYPLGTLAGVTLTANQMYYVPIFLPTDITTDGIVFEVTTAVSGSVQVGLYSCSSTFNPDVRLFMSSKSTVSTTGVKTFAISGAVTGGRWYFVGLASTTAMALRGSTTSANLPSPRGGATATQAFLMASETLAGGWTDIPATATPGSLGDTYLHLGLQAA